MMLNNINLVISTVWREGNYLGATMDNLLLEYPICGDQILCLVAGSPVTTHLEQYRPRPGISIVEMGPHTWAWIKNNITLHRATWNYYRCLTYPPAGQRGTLILEDDVRFARGWQARLDTTLVALEEQYGSDFILALYAPWFSVMEGIRRGQLYVEYPYNKFFGTQGIYYPAKIRQGFARFLRVHGVKANKNHYDILLQQYLREANTPIFATAPCLIQHMGKTSAIETPWHESADFMEDVTAESLEQAE